MSPLFILLLCWSMAYCYGACSKMKCDTYIYLDTTPDPPEEAKKLNIAVLTSGAIRSFAMNEKSWRRYIIEPWQSSNIQVFAHVTSPNSSCEFYEKGIEAMRRLATDMEITYSPETVMSASALKAKLGDQKSCLCFQNPEVHFRGNIIDMHARRHRAYQMSLAYAKNHKFKWDIMMYVRMDSAFYSPKIEFYKIYKGLLNHTAVTGNDSLIVPPGCNFGHVCDRGAIGLPTQMSIYFNESLLFNVANWAHEINANDSERIKADKHSIKELSTCSDEQMMKAWLVHVNHLEVTDTKPPHTSFITQRSRTSNFYCEATRLEFNQNGGRWVDKTTLWWTNSSDFDFVSDGEARCGPIHSYNVSEACKQPSCDCIRE